MDSKTANIFFMNKILLLFLFVFLPLNLFSQIEKINFEHVSEQHNCFHFSITSIVQDKKGFYGLRPGPVCLFSIPITSLI
jgi:hypothetical protein